MDDYLPLLLIALAISAAAAFIGWPWLRRRESRDMAAMLIAVSVFLSLAMYLAVGSPFAIHPIAAHQERNDQLLKKIAELNASPEDTDLKWAQLGAAYMQLEQYKQAEGALRRAVLASEGDPNLIMAYGKAQMLAADGAVTEGAKQAFTLASKLLPDNPEPLFLLAVERMQAGDKEGARKLFRQLLPRLPEGAPLRKRIEERLKETESESHN